MNSIDYSFNSPSGIGSLPSAMVSGWMGDDMGLLSGGTGVGLGMGLGMGLGLGFGFGLGNNNTIPTTSTSNSSAIFTSQFLKTHDLDETK